MRNAFRLMAGLAAALGAGAAGAENYTAKIYGNPAGIHFFNVFGAGDNAMMTGHATPGNVLYRAGYLTNSGFKSLHVDGWDTTTILDSWGSTYHAGFGKPEEPGVDRALFWVGGGPAVLMHPPGAEYTGSKLHGGYNQIQVGHVTGAMPNCPGCDGAFMSQHAGVWSRTATSFRRLHTPDHSTTTAMATDGTRIVGQGTVRFASSKHALMWPTSTSGVVDLHPSGWDHSAATSVWGNEQAGYVWNTAGGNLARAAMWKGSAGSMVLLHPAVFKDSHVEASRNGLQVGYGRPLSVDVRNQAIAWHGKSETWINLHARLPHPFSYLWSSFATDIDAQGNIVGYVEHIADGYSRPVIWLRTP